MYWEIIVLILLILGEAKVKKIYYLELDQDSYTLDTSRNISEIIKNIKQMKVNRTEFFKLLEHKKIKFSMIYEIGKY